MCFTSNTCKAYCFGVKTNETLVVWTKIGLNLRIYSRKFKCHKIPCKQKVMSFAQLSLGRSRGAGGEEAPIQTLAMFKY